MPPGRRGSWPLPHEDTLPGQAHGPDNCLHCRGTAYAWVEAHPRHPEGFPPGKDEFWVVVPPVPLTGIEAKATGPYDEWDGRDRAGHYAGIGLGLSAKLLRVVEEFLPAADVVVEDFPPEDW